MQVQQSLSGIQSSFQDVFGQWIEKLPRNPQAFCLLDANPYQILQVLHKFPEIHLLYLFTDSQIKSQIPENKNIEYVPIHPQAWSELRISLGKYQGRIDALSGFFSSLLQQNYLALLHEMIPYFSKHANVLLVGSSRFTAGIGKSYQDNDLKNFLDPFEIQNEFPDFYTEWNYHHRRGLEKVALSVEMHKIPEKNKIRTLPASLSNDFFSPGLYEKLLNCMLQENYQMLQIRHLGKSLNNVPTENDRHSVVLRHDVDVSLFPALEMARMEKSMGIGSSYFILMSGQYYNPLLEENRKAIRELENLGHEVGLHFDQASEFQTDRKILESILGHPVKSFSQHNPTVNGFIQIPKEDLIDAYDESIQKELNFHYVSDSGMCWRKPSAWDLVGKANIYLLAHPEIWYSHNSDIVENLRKAQNSEMNRVRKAFDEYIELIVQYLRTRKKCGN